MRMELNWFESLIFGFVSGICEFLPVSAQAHETLVLQFFGVPESALLRMIVHAAAWEALYLHLLPRIDALNRERELLNLPQRRRSREPDMQKILDLRFVRTAMIPLILGFLAAPFLGRLRNELSICAMFLFMNGILLYLPGRIVRGNKDARAMSRFDAVLIGLFGALGVLPGISRIGALNTGAAARGADQEHALDWSLLLCVPALMTAVGVDAYELLSVGVGSFDFIMFLSIALAAVTAFIGAKIGISVMRFLAVRAGFTGFAYYCWGAALFIFILYLTI